MSIIMGDLYDTLIDGGTSDEMARKAAQQVADFQKQLGDIESDLALIKGLLGVAVAGVITLVVRVFVA